MDREYRRSSAVPPRFRRHGAATTETLVVVGLVAISAVFGLRALGGATGRAIDDGARGQGTAAPVTSAQAGVLRSAEEVATFVDHATDAERFEAWIDHGLRARLDITSKLRSSSRKVNPPVEVPACCAVALRGARVGFHGLADRALAAGKETAKAVDNDYYRGAYLGQLVDTEATLGRLEDARATAGGISHQAERVGAFLRVAEAQFHHGHLEEGLHTLKRAYAEALEIADDADRPRLLKDAAQVYATQADNPDLRAAAIESFEAAYADVWRTDKDAFRTTVIVDISNGEWALGLHDTARAHLAAAVSGAVEAETPFSRIDQLATLARGAFEHGRIDEAEGIAKLAYAETAAVTDLNQRAMLAGKFAGHLDDIGRSAEGDAFMNAAPTELKEYARGNREGTRDNLALQRRAATVVEPFLAEHAFAALRPHVERALARGDWKDWLPESATDLEAWGRILQEHFENFGDLPDDVAKALLKGVTAVANTDFSEETRRGLARFMIAKFNLWTEEGLAEHADLLQDLRASGVPQAFAEQSLAMVPVAEGRTPIRGVLVKGRGWDHVVHDLSAVPLSTIGKLLPVRAGKPESIAELEALFADLDGPTIVHIRRLGRFTRADGNLSPAYERGMAGALARLMDSHPQAFVVGEVENGANVDPLLREKGRFGPFMW